MRRSFKYNVSKLNELEIKLVKEFDEPEPKLDKKSLIEGYCKTIGCKTDNCDNSFTKTFQTIVEKGGAYCNVCCEENRRNKITETCKSKSKWTFKMLEDLNITLLQDYSKQNLTDRTIIKGICKNEDCINTFEKGFRVLLMNGGPYCTLCTNINLRKKMEATSIERYGVENPFQSVVVKGKITKTNLEKYGVVKASQLKEVQDKMKKTCVEKYGTEWAAQAEEVKDKMKTTFLERYGVEYPLQVKEIHERQQKSGYTFKDYTLPSGKIIRVQGYEPLALDILLETITEEELLTGYKNVPIIWYEMNGNKHRYFTDIFIPSQNKCIEVKSDFTFYKEMEQNLLKQEATKLLGFECEIWIFNSNRKLIEILT
jgi:hypothetical protein